MFTVRCGLNLYSVVQMLLAVGGGGVTELRSAEFPAGSNKFVCQFQNILLVLIKTHFKFQNCPEGQDKETRVWILV